MKTALSFIIAGALVLSAAEASFAQTPAPTTAPAAPAAAAPAAAPATDAAKKAKAKACSEQATAKGLHGKARKEFRAKCKKS